MGKRRKDDEAVDLLSSSEVAGLVGVSRWTVWRFLVRHRHFVQRTSDGRRYVLRRDVEALRRAMMEEVSGG